MCPRCMEKVSRVEQTGLGTVFMCTHEGTRYGNAGCRRTYLSQRDLQVTECQQSNKFKKKLSSCIIDYNIITVVNNVLISNFIILCRLILIIDMYRRHLKRFKGCKSSLLNTFMQSRKWNPNCLKYPPYQCKIRVSSLCNLICNRLWVTIHV